MSSTRPLTLVVTLLLLAAAGCAGLGGGAGSFRPTCVDLERVIDVRTQFGEHRGVAVACGPRAIATCQHVVDGRELRYSAFSGLDGGLLSMTQEVEVGARLLDVDPSRDLVVLETDGAFPYFEVSPPSTGPAVVITTRFGGVPEAYDAWLDAGEGRLQGIDIRPGDSGSPVIQDGRLVGLVRTAEGGIVVLVPRSSPSPEPVDPAPPTGPGTEPVLAAR